MADVKTTKAQRDRLAVLKANLDAGTASYLSNRSAEPLIKLGVIEKHPSEKNEDGDPLVKISEVGIAVLAKHANDTARAAPIVPTGGFELVSDFDLPEPTGRGRREAIYPFDKLDLGQSFFVPATDENKTPAKRLNGTVSSANRRYKDTTPARYFRVAEVEYKGQKGAMVKRIEPPAPAAA